jgi:Peroxidase, family 2
MDSSGHDAFFAPDQTTPARDLIENLLNSASGPVSTKHPEGHITPMDLSRHLSLRFAHSKKDNPVFSISSSQKFFAASNASLLYEVFHGDVATLRTVLLEERLPENFETSYVPGPAIPSPSYLMLLESQVEDAQWLHHT